MVPNLNQTNVDETDPNLAGLFADLQGNILKGHGRDQSINVFLRFTGDAMACRTWLRSMAGHVTSAAQQYKDARDYEATGEDRMLITLLLSADGYRALGFSEEELPGDKAFRAGMRDLEKAYDTAPRGDHKPVANPLSDAPETWEQPFQDGVHALIVLAYGGDHRHPEAAREAHEIMQEQLQQMTASLDGIAEVVLHQEGHALRNERDQVIEHFGYVDGVTNPRFFKGDIDKDRNNGGFDRYDPSAPLSLVLAPDPLGANDAHGSYFVYRKLQQNAKGFAKLKTGLAEKLSEDGGDAVSPGLAGALIVGRFKDGTPVGEQRNDGWSSLPTNYNYSGDIEGRRCPFQSHARKTNPRDESIGSINGVLNL